MAAARVSFTWLGTQKTLTADQIARAAETFDAEARSLSAGKKLLDTRHPAFRAVTAIRTKVDRLLEGDEPAVPRAGRAADPPGPGRGVRRARWPTSRSSWTTPSPNLDRHYGELKRAAAERLGLAVQRRPTTRSRWSGLFDVQWDFPSFEPPDYLRQLCPAVYEQERARVAARFDEAVQLAEQAFLEEFARLVAHLCDRMTGVGRGRPAARLPRLGRGQPVGLLRPLPRAERPLERAARRAGRAGPSVRCGAWRRRTCATAAGAAPAGGVASSPRCSRRSTGCWSSGPGAASCGRRPRRGRRDAPGRSTPAAACDASTPRRSTWPRSAAPRSPAPATSSPTADGRWHADLRPVVGPVLGPFAQPQRGPGGRAGVAGGELAHAVVLNPPAANPEVRPSGSRAAPATRRRADRCRVYVRSIGITIHP